MNAHGITVARIIPLEVERMAEMWSESDEVDRELLPFFEEEARAELKEIERLLQAWDGKETQNPFKELRRRFHTLKGTANTIGHVRLGSIAGGMEELFDRVDPAYAFVLHVQIIKTSIASLQAIQALMQEAWQPKVNPAKRAEIIGAAGLIVDLKHKLVEMRGAA